MRLFPILYDRRDRSSDMFIVANIPREMLAPHEAQAQRNHSQSLQRLADRGGLSACEALAVLENREWRPDAEANRKLCMRVLKWIKEFNPESGHALS